MSTATRDTLDRPESNGHNIHSMVRMRLSVLNDVGEAPSDQKADIALRSAEASIRRGFRQGAKSAYMRAAMMGVSRSVSLRVATVAAEQGFMAAAEVAYGRAVAASTAVADVRTLLQAVRDHGFADAVAQCFQRILTLATTADEAVEAADAAASAKMADIAQQGFVRAMALCEHPHEIRNVMVCASRHGVSLALPEEV